MNDVMLDLETMGTRPGSAIVAIGAVLFDPDSNRMGKTFYRTISLKSNVEAGLTIDPDTVTWWLKQGDDARKQIAEASNHLTQTLISFSLWLQEIGSDVKVWGCGSDFDNVLLAEAYRRVNGALPWRFWNNRCYRTVKSDNPGIKLERTGTHHHALDDAEYQAKHLQLIRKEVGRVYG